MKKFYNSGPGLSLSTYALQAHFYMARLISMLLVSLYDQTDKGLQTTDIMSRPFGQAVIANIASMK